jgi:DNA-binding transcriptional regulator YdaS (Cro superfamily)
MDIQSSNPDATKRAIEKIGGPVAVSKLLNISPQAVSQWSRVPAQHAAKVATATGIAPHELRPDIFPAPAAEGAA